MTLAPDDFGRLTRPFPDPFFLVSGSGEIVAANAAAHRLFELDASPSLYALCADPPERLATLLRRCERSGDFVPSSLGLVRRDGSAVRYRCEGAAIRSADGGAGDRVLLKLRPHSEASRRFLLLNQKVDELAREIHQRQRAEAELHAQTVRLEENAAELEMMVEELERQKLQAQQANQAKSEFLAVMSHELRTPLNAILGYADLIDAEIKGPVTPGQRDQVRRIQRSTAHLVAIIDEILAYSRLEAGREQANLDAGDLRHVASEAVELIEPVAAQRGIELVLRLPDTPVPVETDLAKSRQILLNLLSNAVKFTEGGSIVVTLEQDEFAFRISVTDTGIGIASEDLDHIFEPFWQVEQGTTRRAGGTGLGLTVTRRLARLLGGDVTAQSVPRQGSRFTLELPRYAVDPALAAPFISGTSAAG